MVARLRHVNILSFFKKSLYIFPQKEKKLKK